MPFGLYLKGEITTYTSGSLGDGCVHQSVNYVPPWCNFCEMRGGTFFCPQTRQWFGVSDCLLQFDSCQVFLHPQPESRAASRHLDCQVLVKAHCQALTVS